MKSTIVCLVLSSILLASCGASKKLEAANQQVQNLQPQVQTQQQQIQSLQAQVADGQKMSDELKAQYSKCASDATDCRTALDALVQRDEKIKRLLDEDVASMQEVRRKAATAFEAFHDAGLTVFVKNGFLFVSMPDNMLFASGSTAVNEQGKQALSVVADVMLEYKRLRATVVGNTDTLPVQKSFKDNWSLSTERANAVVRLLQHKYDVDPARLTAAGKGKFDPVEDNSTAEGRAKNRRIEIVITRGDEPK